MRAFMRKVIRRLVTNRATWAALNFMFRFFNRFKFEKEQVLAAEKRLHLAAETQRMEARFAGLKVQNGPFKGMVYPAFVSHGSPLFPKLLGSYECELWEDIERLMKNRYETIIDVGCAEGYYAVGLALRQPQAAVYAYDIDASALDDCRKTARANNISGIRFVHGCAPQTLLGLELKGRCLVVSDCEGYELELFTPEVAAHLAHCDLLIELHDHRNERISPALENRFKKTHDLKLIPSMNTFKKFDRYGFRDQFTDEEIAVFFSERTGYMNWGLFTAKTPGPDD